MRAADINLAEAYAGQQSAHHRGPQEAGSADRYYGRPCKPNFSYNGTHFLEADMTEEQKRIYVDAWTRETDRKNWK